MTQRRETDSGGQTDQAAPLRLGEKVRLRSIQMDGVVAGIGGNEIEVQVGNLRISARPSDVLRRGEIPEQPAPVTARIRRTKKSAGWPAEPISSDAAGKTTLTSAAGKDATPYYPSPGMEIDLRGQRVEEALEALDRYLESAFLAGLPFVRIIHGKGTGKLRSYIREALADSTHVRQWENAMDNEGGEGVTITRLRTGD